MSGFDLTEFFKLSSVLHYNLSAISLNRNNLLSYILSGKRLDTDERLEQEKKNLMLEVLGYLFRAYSHKRRRFGPMAVLHPLRSAALMTRAKEFPHLDSLMTVLFHDILEDVQSVDFEAQEWRDMEQRLFEMLEHMPPAEGPAPPRRIPSAQPKRWRSPGGYRGPPPMRYHLASIALGYQPNTNKALAHSARGNHADPLRAALAQLCRS